MTPTKSSLRESKPREHSSSHLSLPPLIYVVLIDAGPMVMRLREALEKTLTEWWSGLMVFPLTFRKKQLRAA
ncbi:hypothetical protein K443DRAFT_679991 [Laccaria amethystina LaAM-08-1]|uniref:Uncharacterized protein n=1 Tax=Laccaria amethystina LaAM-08-1 TaxID=1095629 RepID=A0A0C9X2S3_9AGAR|nr:hypothetical protein K443DRAFT_679991 [Laccaria amethystina LaAM-08-1]